MNDNNHENGATATDSVHGALNEEFGLPFQFGEKGGVYPNQTRLAKGFAVDRDIKFDPKRQFLEYRGPSSGLWQAVAEHTVTIKIAAYLREYARRSEFENVQRIIKYDLVSDVLEFVKGFAHADFKANCKPGVIHFKNCMVDTRAEPFEPLRFDPEFYSTRQVPYDFDPAAKCPRYQAWLDETMNADDQTLWLHWCGMVLSGLNTAQKILILSGIGGSSKGQHVRTVCDLIGGDNCLEFRTRNLSQRFEMAKLIDKSLLVGSDVSPNFLSEAAAHYLKSLTGEDLISAELKNVNGSVLLSGEYNVVMTSNTKLRVRLEGDVEAWRRRLMVINFTKQVKNQVPNFARSILEEEASGIVNVMLGGLRDLREHGFDLTRDQKGRVDDLLGESDSVRRFIEEMVDYRPDEDLTTEELVSGHERYCVRRGWLPASRAIVEKNIHDVMHDMFNVTARHDLIRGRNVRRGFSGFVLRPESYQVDKL